ASNMTAMNFTLKTSPILPSVQTISNFSDPFALQFPELNSSSNVELLQNLSQTNITLS
ncbi:hypothetical protein LOAG_15286, partial [Loa loa]